MIILFHIVYYSKLFVSIAFFNIEYLSQFQGTILNEMTMFLAAKLNIKLLYFSVMLTLMPVTLEKWHF